MTGVVAFVDMYRSYEPKDEEDARANLIIRHNQTVAAAIDDFAASRGLVQDRDYSCMKFVYDSVMAWFVPSEALTAVECMAAVMRRLVDAGITTTLQPSNVTNTEVTDALPRSAAALAMGPINPYSYAPPQTRAVSRVIQDQLGSPIDTAAQLVALAQPGQILIDWTTMEASIRAAGNLAMIEPQNEPGRTIEPADVVLSGRTLPTKVTRYQWRGDLPDGISSGIPEADIMVRFLVSLLDYYEGVRTLLPLLRLLDSSAYDAFDELMEKRLEQKLHFAAILAGINYLGVPGIAARWRGAQSHMAEFHDAYKTAGHNLGAPTWDAAHRAFLAPFEQGLGTIKQLVEDAKALAGQTTHRDD